jgi:hypothetical protein
MADETITDWANLPDDVESVSIWDSVHDGSVRAIRSNLLGRTLTIEFAVPYLLAFHGLPQDWTFTFTLEGVQSARVLRFAIWPGQFEMPPGLSWDEQQKLIEEYRAKWRQQSESWDKFERDITSGEEAELTTGALALGADGAVALRLGVQMSDGVWHDTFIRAQRLRILRSDGQGLDIGRFVEMGNAYWEAFAAKQNPPQT